MTTTPTPSATTITVNLSTLQDAAVQALIASLNGLITGAAADLQTYAAGIIADTMTAAAAGDQTTLTQLSNQALSLLEINRLRAVAATEQVVNNIIQAALALLLKLIPAIPVAA